MTGEHMRANPMEGRLRFLLLCVLLYPACQSPPEPIRLAAFELAMQCAPTEPKKPVLFEGFDNVPKNELVPYAWIPEHRTHDWKTHAIYLWTLAVPHRPDAVVYGEGNRINTGSISTNVGFGVFMSQATHAIETQVVLLREAQACMPFRLSNAAMVMTIEEEAADQGLLEGDTVVAIDGCAVTVDDNAMRSEHLAGRLKLRAGEPVEVIAIRPGVGRVKTKVTPIPSARKYLQHDCGIDLGSYQVQVDSRGKWRAHNMNASDW